MPRSAIRQRLNTLAGATTLILLFSEASSFASPLPRRTPFIKKGAVVCARKQDIIKVRQSINSLRYFGQVRALLSDGRCRLYSRREKVIDMTSSSQTDHLAAVQIRTEDKPDVVRWILQRDLRDITHFRHRI